MELYSVNNVVFLHDIWMDETGDVSIVERIDVQNEDGECSIKIRVLTGSCANNTYFEDEWKFEDISAGVEPNIEDDEPAYFNCLLYRPLTGYQNANMIDYISEVQSAD